jgi:hypothetical protein
MSHRSRAENSVEKFILFRCKYYPLNFFVSAMVLTDVDSQGTIFSLHFAKYLIYALGPNNLTEEEAKSRHSLVSNVIYDIDLDIQGGSPQYLLSFSK